jgi:hypothetical protein
MRYLVGGLLFVRAFNSCGIVGLYVKAIWVLLVLFCFKRIARGRHFSHYCWVAETLVKI